jgi:phosphoribosylaminoimidazole (AIR) synthetase
MFRAFNMGVGMIVVAGAAEGSPIVDRLSSAGEDAWIAGEIVAEALASGVLLRGIDR